MAGEAINNGEAQKAQGEEEKAEQNERGRKGDDEIVKGFTHA